jgi:hypothetical protein
MFCGKLGKTKQNWRKSWRSKISFVYLPRKNTDKMRVKFTPQSVSSLKINLILLASYVMVSNFDNLFLGFGLGVLNFFFVLNEIHKYSR